MSIDVNVDLRGITKECPFCGSEDLCIRKIISSYAVYCKSCNSYGPINDDLLLSIRLWNKRCENQDDVM